MASVRSSGCRMNPKVGLLQKQKVIKDPVIGDDVRRDGMYQRLRHPIVYRTVRAKEQGEGPGDMEEARATSPEEVAEACAWWR